MTTPARTLAPRDVRRLLAHVRDGRLAHRNECIVMLSFRAGLRACEIAGLDWAMVVTARGYVGDLLAVAGSIAKNGRARVIPLHPELIVALKRLHRDQGKPIAGPVILSQRGGHMTPRSIVNWFAGVYAELGYDGCSSHSGRRTFITRAARVLTRSGGSLRDVQELAGHRALTTTERYIEGDRVAQRRLIRLI